MRLIFLHGAPASGKLTVAKSLLHLLPGRLFDNHAAIDLARTIFDFGAPGFWELVHAVRSTALEAAATHKVPLIVLTYCYSHPEDQEPLAQFETIVKRHQGEFLPVFLHCSDAETERRIGNQDRHARRKITSVAGLRNFQRQWNIVPVPRANCLVLDSGLRPPEDTAQEIIGHFGLNRP